MKLSLQKNKKDLKTISVELDDITLNLPYAEFQTKESHHILITGGIDGDEYTGIEAAYQLIDLYKKKAPSCNVTILPLINIPGFLENVSQNPLDNKYPKHIYPGRPNGSASEQLIHWLNVTFLKNTTLWIDLHAGALTEALTPFIWAYKTKNKKHNALIEHLLQNISADLKIYDNHVPSKISNLAKKNIRYMILESGQKGERDESAIMTHVTWVKSIIDSLKGEPDSNNSLSNLYHTVDEYNAQKTGIWRPYCSTNKKVTKGQLLGEIYSFDQKKIQTITAKHTGVILWMKSTMAIKRGEIAFGIAHK